MVQSPGRKKTLWIPSPETAPLLMARHFANLVRILATFSKVLLVPDSFADPIISGRSITLIGQSIQWLIKSDPIRIN